MIDNFELSSAIIVSILIERIVFTGILYLICKYKDRINADRDVVYFFFFGWIGYIIAISFDTSRKDMIYEDEEISENRNYRKKIRCKVCGKWTPYNEYGTCEKCNKKIMERLEKNNDKEDI